MKKFLLVLIISLFSLYSFSQEWCKDVKTCGYYYGVVDDSSMNKHIFITFLSNGGDNIIHITPYIINDGEDISFIHNDYKKSLSKSDGDSIDGNIFIDYGWNIPGFDNYCYYSLLNNNLSFSLNIANLDKPHLDVFYFKGKILDGGMVIESIISSTDSIFLNSVLILKYKQL